MNNQQLLNSQPYWYRLLIHFERNRYFENGLNIPFIIGSRQYLEPGQPLHSIQELIETFADAPYNFNVLMCGQFGAYMFRISIDAEYGYYNKVGNLVIQGNSFAQAKTVLDIIPELTLEYADEVTAAHYSRKPGILIPYTSTDIGRIDEIVTH